MNRWRCQKLKMQQQTPSFVHDDSGISFLISNSLFKKQKTQRKMRSSSLVFSLAIILLMLMMMGDFAIAVEAPAPTLALAPSHMGLRGLKSRQSRRCNFRHHLYLQLHFYSICLLRLSYLSISLLPLHHVDGLVFFLVKDRGRKHVAFVFVFVFFREKIFILLLHLWVWIFGAWNHEKLW